MKLTFLGHSAFKVEGQDNFLIDPFITGNPACKFKAADLAADYILVSHGHLDHLGDAISIAKKCKATIIGVYELANYCGRYGAKAHALHIGGSHRFGNSIIKLVPAWHGSSVQKDDGSIEYTGNPCGFIIRTAEKVLYHLGDTGLFGDLELIGRLHSIDLAMVPIGDNFTMGPDDAVEAVKMLKAKTVIPMHYNTWPLIEQDPLEFKKRVENETTSRVVVLNPGQTLTL